MCISWRGIIGKHKKFQWAKPLGVTGLKWETNIKISRESCINFDWFRLPLHCCHGRVLWWQGLTFGFYFSTFVQEANYCGLIEENKPSRHFRLCSTLKGKYAYSTLIEISRCKSPLFYIYIHISEGVPRQAEVSLGVPGRLRPWFFSTFGTTRVVGS